jgi:cytochrome c peroxidase
VRTALVRLGGALAFDKVLSGTNDISCMTCHHPSLGTGDARSLSIGQGASGLGALRTLPRGTSFIARNSPALFNLSGLNRLFHDGRVAVENGAFRTPAGAQLTPEMIRVLEFGALSALPMFPVTDRAEMRGATGNELAEIADTDFTGIWAGLMRRLGRVPEYRTMFEAAYPGTPFDQMTFAHASNAIAGYLIEAFTFTNSPLDQFLGGSDTSMSESQLRGAQAFVQQGCIACHTGPSLSDQQFHNTALAQIGPGKGNGESGRDDYGRLNVTQQNQDRYRFRTLPLRNIELTAPYGHAGEFIRLRDFVDHYSRSADKLRAYDVQQLEEPLRGTLLANFDQILANRDQRLGPTNFGPQTTDQITDFLRALTDPIAWSLEFLVPTRVPSGLPVDR